LLSLFSYDHDDEVVTILLIILIIIENHHHRHYSTNSVGALSLIPSSFQPKMLK
jgi:hypothetical protein